MPAIDYKCNICNSEYFSEDAAKKCIDKHLKIKSCSFCDKEVKFLNKIEYILSSATRLTIECSYGSEFDGLKFNGVICDSCIEKYFIKKKKEEVGVKLDDGKSPNIQNKKE